MYKQIYKKFLIKCSYKIFPPSNHFKINVGVDGPVVLEHLSISNVETSAKAIIEYGTIRDAILAKNSDMIIKDFSFIVAN